MTPETLKAYDKFIFKNWGRRKPTGDFTEVDEVAEAVLRYDEEEKKLRLEQEALGNVPIELGKETEYDRLALLAVSVFHLAHWRCDVTVHNYCK